MEKNPVNIPLRVLAAQFKIDMGVKTLQEMINAYNDIVYPTLAGRDADEIIPAINKFGEILQGLQSHLSSTKVLPNHLTLSLDKSIPIDDYKGVGEVELRYAIKKFNEEAKRWD